MIGRAIEQALILGDDEIGIADRVVDFDDRARAAPASVGRARGLTLAFALSRARLVDRLLLDLS